MTELRARLVKCFSAVFPQLSETEILLADATSMSGWDSLASITLITVIEEEFAIQVEPEDVEYLVSFEKVLGYLEKIHSSAVSE